MPKQMKSSLLRQWIGDDLNFTIDGKIILCQACQKYEFLRNETGTQKTILLAGQDTDLIPATIHRPKLLVCSNNPTYNRYKRVFGLFSRKGQIHVAVDFLVKRVRNSNCDEECCDFMPLSKRINNLHINNGNCYNGLGFQHAVSEQGDVYEPSREDWGSMDAGGQNRNEPLEQNRNGCQPVIEANTSNPRQSATSSGWIMPQYTPSLTETDNPYYYENNKLLFALYLERIHRNGGTLY